MIRVISRHGYRYKNHRKHGFLVLFCLGHKPLHRGSYMSADELLKYLKELRKLKDGWLCQAFYLFFELTFNKFNNILAQMPNYITYHLPLTWHFLMRLNLEITFYHSVAILNYIFQWTILTFQPTLYENKFYAQYSLRK